MIGREREFYKVAPFGTHCPCSAFTCNTPGHGHLSTPVNSNPRRLIATRESMLWTGHHLFHLPSAAGRLDHLQSCTVRWLVICRAYCTRIRRLTHDYFIMIHPWEGISASQGVSISDLLQHSPKWPSKNLVSDRTVALRVQGAWSPHLTSPYTRFKQERK